MTVTKCDKCGKEMNCIENQIFINSKSLYIKHKEEHILELCDECVKPFIELAKELKQ